MRLQRLRLELRMGLAAEEEGMVGNLDNLDIIPSGVEPLMRNPPAVNVLSYSRFNS